jgi:hypothetical protein
MISIWQYIYIPQRPTHASLDIFQNNVEAKVEVKAVIEKKKYLLS